MQLVVVRSVFLELAVGRILIFARLHLLDPDDIVRDGRYFARRHSLLFRGQRVGNLIPRVLARERVHFLVRTRLDILVYQVKKQGMLDLFARLLKHIFCLSFGFLDDLTLVGLAGADLEATGVARHHVLVEVLTVRGRYQRMLSSGESRSRHVHPVHHETGTISINSGALVDLVPTESPLVCLHDWDGKRMQCACYIDVRLLLGLLLRETHDGVRSLLGDTFD